MRQMILVGFLQAQNCTNLASSWRHAQSRTDSWGPDFYHNIGRVLEEGRFHLGFFDDRLSMPDMYGRNHEHTVAHGIRCVKLDAVTVLTVMGMATERLGLGATYSTSYYEPFHVARVFATLDLMTYGRAAWNVVTSLNDGEAQNMGRDEAVAHDLRFDRDPEAVKITHLVNTVAAATKAEAEDKWAQIEKLPLEIDALSLLSEALNFDFARKGMDEAFTDQEMAEISGLQAIRDRVVHASGNKNPTAREFIHFSGRGRVHNPIVGGPKEVADQLEQWFVAPACDGFVVSATHVPGAYEDFVRFVVPELQRRGLFRKDYAGKTLRENLGVPIPPLAAWGGVRAQGRRDGAG